MTPNKTVAPCSPEVVFHDVSDRRNARGDDAQKNPAAEIAAGERTAHAAQEEKGGDDDLPYEDAQIPRPVPPPDLLRPRKNIRAEHFVEEGKNVVQAEHEVVDDHQAHAKPAQKVDFPEPFPGAPAIAARHLFIAGKSRIFLIDSAKIHPLQFTISAAPLSNGAAAFSRRKRIFSQSFRNSMPATHIFAPYNKVRKRPNDRYAEKISSNAARSSAMLPQASSFARNAELPRMPRI